MKKGVQETFQTDDKIRGTYNGNRRGVRNGNRRNIGAKSAEEARERRSDREKRREVGKTEGGENRR